MEMPRGRFLRTFFAGPDEYDLSGHYVEEVRLEITLVRQGPKQDPGPFLVKEVRADYEVLTRFAEDLPDYVPGEWERLGLLSASRSYGLKGRLTRSHSLWSSIREALATLAAELHRS